MRDQVATIIFVVKTLSRNVRFRVLKSTGERFTDGHDNDDRRLIPLTIVSLTGVNFYA